MSEQETPSPDASAERTAEPIQVVMVSGFLGAGKTTALKTVGEWLSERGYTVGMVTNDQASGLVDTSILAETDGTVVEIPGGCFCCNFGDLLNAAYSIRTEDVDVLLAEPVGSCTDLVATVINPLREMYAEEFAVAPLTVVLDPDRVRAYLSEDTARLPEEVRYIFRMQIDEADVLVLNKTDTLTDDETARLVAELERRAGGRPVFTLSARQGNGVEPWMSAIFDDLESPAVPAFDEDVSVQGRALTDIDYDTYADGEARLGWVNLSVSLDGQFDVDRFQRDLMSTVRRSLQAADIEVAHLKFSTRAAETLSHANLTSTASEPRYSGPAPESVTEGRLVFNARAVGDPERIRAIADDAIADAGPTDLRVTVEQAQAFRPAYPEPQHRIDDPDSDVDTSGMPQCD